jgi:chromosome segregation ATPase
MSGCAKKFVALTHVMATVEEIKQQLERANKEYDEVKAKLDRLDALRRGRAQEDFQGELAELEGERKKLEERRDRWEAEVQKWGEALRAESMGAGNDFVRLGKTRSRSYQRAKSFSIALRESVCSLYRGAPLS